MTEHRDDWWGRLPGWVRAAIAVATVWAAGWTSSWAAQEYRGLPDAVLDHEARISVLERVRVKDQDRAMRAFLYTGCRLDEIVAGKSGTRCDLVLDDYMRELLQQLRSP